MNLGIDIGGTSIKMGLVDENGKIYDKYSYLESYEQSAKIVIEKLKKEITCFLHGAHTSFSDIESIGVGCPGAINSSLGTVDFASNLHWQNVKLVEELKVLHPNVRLSNDANAAGLGEAIFGAGKKYNNVVMITLGTGIGGAVIIDKKLYEGHDGKGTEIGHMIIKHNGVECSCGLKGCFEAYGSATALIKQAKKEMQRNKSSKLWELVDNNIDLVEAKTVFDAELLGDASAKKVLNKYVEYLGTGLISLCNIFRPEVIIIGGGLSKQKENLTNRLVKYLEKFDYGFKGTPRVEITCARLENDAGIVGAAALFSNLG